MRRDCCLNVANDIECTLRTMSSIFTCRLRTVGWTTPSYRPSTRPSTLSSKRRRREARFLCTVMGINRSAVCHPRQAGRHEPCGGLRARHAAAPQVSPFQGNKEQIAMRGAPCDSHLFSARLVARSHSRRYRKIYLNAGATAARCRSWPWP